MMRIITIILLLISATVSLAAGINPRLELAKQLLKEGDGNGAHKLVRSILEKNPGNPKAQYLMKQILLSETPILGGGEKLGKETKHFLLPHLTKRQDFLRMVHLDEYIDRWERLMGRLPDREKIRILLFESKEAFLLVSKGKEGYFISQTPPTIGVDPRITRKAFTTTFQKSLFELLMSRHYPNVNVPSGVKAGLIATLSPLMPKPKPVAPAKVLHLLSRKPENNQRAEAVTALIFMLNDLNPRGLRGWFSQWDKFDNPLEGLLTYYSFNNWGEMQKTFDDYLKRFNG